MRDLIAAVVARSFYLDGRSKSQIADELGISRFRVARILEHALSHGIVRIEVAGPPEVDLELAETLRSAYGLRQVVVVRTDPAGPDTTRRHLGRACAALLAERITADDVLGVSWGRTLHAFADVVPRLPAAGVVQMVGSVPTADLRVNSLELLRRLGDSTGGPVHALHVPMVLDAPATAAALRTDTSVADTLARFGDITCAVVGIGGWRPDDTDPYGSTLRAALPADVIARLDTRGAVADVCATVLNADGDVIGGDDVQPRCIAVTTTDLRHIPDVIAVAGGAGKAAAITAAVRAGLVHRLITDTAAALSMLTPGQVPPPSTIGSGGQTERADPD